MPPRMARRMDATRLAALVRGPGMDTRVHLALASVDDVCYDDTAGNEGVYADVTYLSDGTPETCVVGSVYAGAGFGLYCPLAIGDVVLVAVPFGNPDAGPVIISRLWDSGDPPPSDLAGVTQEDGTKDPTEDFVLRVESNTNLRIRTAGSGNISIKAEGSGDIRIEQAGTGNIVLKVTDGKLCYVGDETGAEPIALGQTLKDFLGSVKSWMDGHKHAYTAPGPTPTLTSAPVTDPAGVIPDPSPAVAEVRAAKGRVK